jgi:hypothetical protein
MPIITGLQSYKLIAVIGWPSHVNFVNINEYVTASEDFNINSYHTGSGCDYFPTSITPPDHDFLLPFKAPPTVVLTVRIKT